MRLLDCPEYSAPCPFNQLKGHNMNAGSRKKTPILVERTDGTETRATVSGRELWALDNLCKAGSAGCTPIEHPGPRWSGYVYDLRQMGIEIETIRERHGDPFPGHHGRYVLRSRVTKIEGDRA
jgi:hypothetical protein